MKNIGQNHKKGAIKNLGKFISIFILVILAIPTCYGQYLISGYISPKQKNKTIYLSVLKYSEEYMMTENQILFTVKTDSTGYFEFKGQLLPEQDKLYRIHSNITEDKSFQLVIKNDREINFHNFIFSNKDTLYFQKTKDIWFGNSLNTNVADKQWAKFRSYQKKITQGISPSKNDEVQQQAMNDLAAKITRYSQDSLTHPLVKLLSYSYIKRTGVDLKKAFEKNPDFYYNIQKALNTGYSETSYYRQYQEEVAELSNSIILKKYVLHKNLNYILGFLVLGLSFLSFFLFRKLSLIKAKEIKNEVPTLTSQEEKIVKLIFEDKSNKEIADKLFISLSTVKTHIRNLYSKLDVANRHELSEKLKNQPED